MNGGSTSGGPKETSGSDTGKKTNVVDIGGYSEMKQRQKGSKKSARENHLEDQVKDLKAQLNIKHDLLRALQKEANHKLGAIRQMYSDQTEELIQARLKVDKYITRCDNLKDQLHEAGLS